MTIEELETKSITELKALVYDWMGTIEAAQKNVQTLHQIIGKKAQQENPKSE